jgi:hypothetical protein
MESLPVRQQGKRVDGLPVASLDAGVDEVKPKRNRVEMVAREVRRFIQLFRPIHQDGKHRFFVLGGAGEF